MYYFFGFSTIRAEFSLRGRRSKGKGKGISPKLPFSKLPFPSLSNACEAEFILDYWIKSDDFWDSLRTFRSSQSSDSFKIYTIVPIVRIELNSIQAIEVVSVVRIVCDRLSSVSI